MFVVLPLSLLAFGTPAVVGFPLAVNNTRRAAQATSVILNGETYVNKGLVAFGLIPSDATEWNGDTIGGIGSAIALSSFSAGPSGTYTGQLVVQPDRGYNVEGTIDYQGRQLFIDFTLTPYSGTTPLSFAAAQQTLQLSYSDTLFYFDRGSVATTGLDSEGVRAAQSGYPTSQLADPPMPIPSSTFNHLSLDLEGLALAPDGTFWVSDEYGPYIYHFDEFGDLIQTIQPPQAIVPLNSAGQLSFTSGSDPVTGRGGNQGFEGLTLSSDGNTLYALLQSAAIQDGGNKKSNARYTRLVAYDISRASTTRPTLVGEWVVPLPLDSAGKTLGASELHYVKNGVFLVLARDGNGHGGDATLSAYKRADLISTVGATDIHGTSFDSPSHPIASGGVLSSSIVPATYVSFVDYLDSTQLARFGLHNGDPSSQTLIDAKWESVALAPVSDPTAPDDYFLFTASDNDFMSTNGVFDGEPFNAGLDNDNQFLVFRVTLPGAQVAI